jgi:hypothetical protein
LVRAQCPLPALSTTSLLKSAEEEDERHDESMAMLSEVRQLLATVVRNTG